MPTIVPAILCQTLEEVQRMLDSIRGVVREVQVDIADGIFVPNKTWPYGDGQTAYLPALPYASEFDFEIDLMINDPEDAAETWRTADPRRIVIHVDAPGAREALMAMRFARVDRAEPNGLLVGIALPCNASPDVLVEYEALYDYVQVMGIEKVGFQGQPFAPEAIELVRALKEANPTLAIQVDGGVSEENISALVAAGASRLIVGSHIWESPDPLQEIQTLQSLANNV